jgi:hypothetical protein
MCLLRCLDAVAPPPYCGKFKTVGVDTATIEAKTHDELVEVTIPLPEEATKEMVTITLDHGVDRTPRAPGRPRPLRRGRPRSPVRSFWCLAHVKIGVSCEAARENGGRRP